MKQDNVSATHQSEPLAGKDTENTNSTKLENVNNKWKGVSTKNDSADHINEPIDENASNAKSDDDSTSMTEQEEHDWQARYQEILAQNAALQKTIEELKQKAESTKLYHAAELKNEQTRAAQDNIKAEYRGYEKAVQAFIPLDDSVYASLNYSNGTAEQYREGAQHILNQMKSIFEKLSITVIAPRAGDKFDPYIHTAAGTEVVDQKVQAPDTVVKVFQKGYKLQNRIIRPAMVTVSKVEEEKKA